MSRQARNSQSQQERAVALRADGRTFQEIAQAVGTDIQGAIDLTAQDSATYRTLRAVKVEATYVENGADRMSRVQNLSQIRQRLTDELAQRSLADVPTDKLITLLIKLNESIRDDVTIPPIYSTHSQSLLDEAWGAQPDKMNL